MLGLTCNSRLEANYGRNCCCVNNRINITRPRITATYDEAFVNVCIRVRRYENNYLQKNRNFPCLGSVSANFRTMALAWTFVGKQRDLGKPKLSFRGFAA